MAITVYKKGTVKQEQLRCEIFQKNSKKKNFLDFFFQNHEMAGNLQN